MSTRLYTLDDRSVVGNLEIDAQHREIARLSNHLVELLDTGAGFAAVRRAFDTLAATLLDHFETEEGFLASRRDKSGVKEHLERHLDNHDMLRSAVSLASDKFVEKEASGEIPEVAAALPERYFEQLKDLDAEMAALVNNRGFA